LKGRSGKRRRKIIARGRYGVLSDCDLIAISKQAKIWGHFHFPFSIFHLSFAIARIRMGQAMANDKWNMENEISF